MVDIAEILINLNLMEIILERHKRVCLTVTLLGSLKTEALITPQINDMVLRVEYNSESNRASNFKFEN